MNYYSYPNVALSCIFDFDKIKNDLTEKEKSYFFKSVVDCVVFKEENNNYTPEFFYELDSTYHDTEKAIENDNMKNKIFELSGVKLIRIRADKDKLLSIDEFKNAIKDTSMN